MKKGVSTSPNVGASSVQVGHLENLIMEISSQIINSPTSKIDGKIRWALRKIVECLDVDDGCFWEMTQDGTELRYMDYPTYHYIDSRFENAVSSVSGKDFPWFEKRGINAEATFCIRIEDLPEDAMVDKKSLRSIGVKSLIEVPYRFAGRVINGLTFGCRREERRFPAELAPILKLAGEIISSALSRKRMEEQYESLLMEMQNLPGRVPLEKRYLQWDAEHKRTYNIIGESAAIKDVFFRMEQVAPTDSIVLILGETGTGKGMIARALHELSSRKNRPCVIVNCAAFPSTLIESELFGREKGAFTGSDSRQIGRFELADKGTLILDEIAELPLEVQAKLLRVIQDGEFERLGSPKTIKVDVRIAALTSRDLKAELSKGRFRHDLYYRLNVFPITVPPLRERYEDIPLLTDHFLMESSRKMKKEIKAISVHTLKKLSSYVWPGNVRELKHVIERAVIMTQKGDTLHLAELLEDQSLFADDEPPVTNLAEVERRHILRVLDKTKWKIWGPGGAAILLGLNPSTLRGRMRKLGIPFRRDPLSNT
jgi:formate hydrogenlyase transcriptional activator